MNDSRELLEFVSEFLHSQMFERFCEERMAKIKAGNKGSEGSTRSSGR